MILLKLLLICQFLVGVRVNVGCHQECNTYKKADRGEKLHLDSEVMKLYICLALFTFNSIKTRNHLAPTNTGANIQTKYHWYIIAEQFAEKIDANSYMTTMKGEKFKLGHKRPHWRTYDYNYPEQTQLKDRIIEILEHILENLRKR